MFDGLWVGGPVAPPAPRGARWWGSPPFRVGLAALALLCSYGAALAQSGAPNDCSGSASGTASLVSFPKAGTTGPSGAKEYLTIQNIDAANTIWINPMPNGAAAASTAGSYQLIAGATISWARPAYAPPARLSIIAPAGATNYTCAYR